jgi:dephospho-CoA kinase
MDHQIDRNHRLQQADDILDNNDNIEALRNAVTRLHHKYLTMTA